MIYLREVQEQTKLIHGDRNQNSGCLCQEWVGIDWKGLWGNFLGLEIHSVSWLGGMAIQVDMVIKTHYVKYLRSV